MNERIEKLANQLGPVATIGNWGRVDWADNVYPQLGDKMYAAIDLAEFAELIVLECADIANKQFSAASGLDDRDSWTAAEIKKHFGVEE